MVLGFSNFNSQLYQILNNFNRIESIIKILKNHPNIELAILYGSVAEDKATFESDIDIAVAGQNSLSSDKKMSLINELATASGRSVDLVDLQTTHGTLLKQILTRGSKIYSNNKPLYANILKRMLFEDADMMPYYYRTIRKQRDRWLSK